MLTVICPNCRHRFPAPGCCAMKEPNEVNRNEVNEKKEDASATLPTTSYYVGGLLVPRDYTTGGGCFINAPTIVHSPQRVLHPGSPHFVADTNLEMTDRGQFGFPVNAQTSLAEHNHRPPVRARTSLSNDSAPIIVAKFGRTQSERFIATTCELTGGSVTIATPDIQSGGCLIQSTKDGILVQAPHIEIRPKLTGGGCVVQTRSSTDDERLMTTSSQYADDVALGANCHRTVGAPPSGCSELPGSREMPFSNTIVENSEIMNTEFRQPKISSGAIKANGSCDCGTTVQNLCQCGFNGRSNTPITDDRESLVLQPVGSGMKIEVNATLQLPASMGQCKVNITATTATPSTNQIVAAEPRVRNNFNGGGIVQSDESDCATGNLTAESSNNERREGAPTTPVSWLMPCPWSLDTYLLDKDINRLCEVKRLLQTCGWYHEGISWQQSENLLKDAAVGRWLMRDSSDSRYTFAVSVQTARGPTSVRVHYFLERFRLDAEPRLALAMPLFDCPIRMLEHYVEYSKRMDEHRKEVWVDYSGQLYSQIYLTKPLVKEVRSLSHLARLAVNRNKLPTEHLPLLIRNYLAEYPYTL